MKVLRVLEVLGVLDAGGASWRSSTI